MKHLSEKRKRGSVASKLLLQESAAKANVDGWVKANNIADVTLHSACELLSYPEKPCYRECGVKCQVPVGGQEAQICRLLMVPVHFLH